MGARRSRGQTGAAGGTRGREQNVVWLLHQADARGDPHDAYAAHHLPLRRASRRGFRAGAWVGHGHLVDAADPHRPRHFRTRRGGAAGWHATKTPPRPRRSRTRSIDKDWRVRAAAVHSLALRNDPALRVDLEPMFEDDKEEVRLRAAAGLLRLSAVQAKASAKPSARAAKKK